MRLENKRIVIAFALIAISLTLNSCEKELRESTPEINPVQSNPNPQFVNMNLPGRTLAANCFQCHGTNGYAGELKIASMSSSEITSKLIQYSSSPANADIMNVHALAYTPSEITLIADYFSQQ